MALPRTTKSGLIQNAPVLVQVPAESRQVIPAILVLLADAKIYRR